MRVGWLFMSAWLGLSPAANADAPFMAYEWAPVFEGCGEYAKQALRQTGFKRTSNPDNMAEAVGVRDDYKAVIACMESSEVPADEVDGKTVYFGWAVFMVAGPDYGEAEAYARKLKAKFNQ
jgi:hypothetical protein